MAEISNGKSLQRKDRYGLVRVNFRPGAVGPPKPEADFPTTAFTVEIF